MIARPVLTSTALALVFGYATGVGPVAAQGREIVQPLPPAGSEQLADALGRLARNSRDLNALLDAGDAAARVGDSDAADGFYGRAEALSPGHPRVKLGMARAMLRQRRPVEALRLFAEAERAGMPLLDMAADRALAFDLVGDIKSAQDLYRLALRSGANPEVTRRLALSQAIAGDRSGFEATLLPLLTKGDLSAFRTRAFGLAILGEEAEANKIAKARMPARVADQMAPYLGYMPRLTRAQQAAAANLGIFPKAAAIGSDEPTIASWANANLAARAAVPAPPVATAASTKSDRKARKTLAGSTGSLPRYTPPAARPAPPPPPPPASKPMPFPAPTARPAPAPAPAQKPALPVAPIATLPKPTPTPPAVLPATKAAVTPPVVVTPIAPTPTPEPAAPEPETLAQAFADFDTAALPVAQPGAGAVDVTKIRIRREPPTAPPAPPPPPPPPPPPKEPSRHWVQLATGKDRSALAFDWRRMAKKGGKGLEGKGPFIAKWGQAQRLLAGPYPSEEAAKKALKALKDAGLDGFTFTSAVGEKVEALK